MCLEECMKSPSCLNDCTPVEDQNGVEAPGFGLDLAASCDHMESKQVERISVCLALTLAL